MDWKDLALTVGKIAPMIGTVLGGPAGATVGSIVASALGAGNTADEVAQALEDPASVVKLKELEANRQVQLQQLAIQAEANRLTAETSAIQAANATMQVEDKAEHWPSYTWRPFCGFVFGAMFFGVYFVLPLIGKTPPAVPYEAWVAIGAVLGVASWHRGAAQVEQARAGNSPDMSKG